MNLKKFLVENKLAISFSEGIRLIACGAVKVNGVEENDFLRELLNGDVIEFRNKEFIHSAMPDIAQHVRVV